MKRALGGALAAVATGLAIANGCSAADPFSEAADAHAPPVDAPRPDAPPTDAYWPDPDPPPGLPAGWELDKSYWNQCGIYVPTSKNYLPPPMTWEPCVDALGDAAPPNCKLMIAGWVGAAAGTPRGTAEAAWKDPSSGLVLGLKRVVSDTFVVEQFAEADGVVRSAILQTRTNFCGLAFPSIANNRYGLVLLEAKQESGGGLLASELDSLRPRIVKHLDEAFAHSIYAAPFAVLDHSGGAFHRWSWDDGTELPILWSAAGDDGLQQSPPIFTSDAMFWSAGNGRYRKIKVYTPSGGVQDFISVGLAIDHNVGDLGADDTDLVWIDAQGRDAGSTPFDTLTIMTSPFTTDSAKVTQRRLRTEGGTAFGVWPFVVGCGYAARSNGIHIRVVRLSDGWSWVLPAQDPGSPISWETPLALTCTELFATVHAGTRRTARIRLDSLGPGVAPD